MQFDWFGCLVSSILLVGTNGEDASTLHVHRNIGTIDCCVDGLSTSIILARTEVIPTSLVDREIGAPSGHASFRDRIDEQRLAKHILMLLCQSLCVVGEIEDEWTHERAALESDSSGIAIDVRQQAIAVFQRTCNDALSLAAIVPRFCVAHVTMHTHQRQIDRCLYPTQHTLDVCLILILVARTEETTCIVCPPRNTCCLHAQACCDLATESFPVIAYIARPHGRAITLNAGEAATGENHRTLLSIILSQTLIHRLVHQQWIDVAEQFARIFAIHHTTSHQVIILRLCSILPPCIDAQWHQTLAEVAPIGIGCSRVEEVNPISARNIKTLTKQLLAHF